MKTKNKPRLGSELASLTTIATLPSINQLSSEMLTKECHYTCDQCKQRSSRYANEKEADKVFSGRVSWHRYADFYGNELHLCAECDSNRTRETAETIVLMQQSRGLT